MQQIKPGIYSSEFWATVISAALSAALPYLINMPDVYKVISDFISVLTIINYTFNRSQLKQTAITPPVPVNRTLTILKGNDVSANQTAAPSGQ